MNTQERLETVVEEYNKIVEEIKALEEKRLQFMGKALLLQEIALEEQSKEASNDEVIDVEAHDVEPKST